MPTTTTAIPPEQQTLPELQPYTTSLIQNNMGGGGLGFVEFTPSTEGVDFTIGRNHNSLLESIQNNERTFLSTRSGACGGGEGGRYKLVQDPTVRIGGLLPKPAFTATPEQIRQLKEASAALAELAASGKATKGQMKEKEKEREEKENHEANEEEDDDDNNMGICETTITLVKQKKDYAKECCDIAWYFAFVTILFGILSRYFAVKDKKEEEKARKERARCFIG